MEILANQSDWAQKYRPQKLEEMILPDAVLSRLINIRDKGHGPSMLFHGSAGTGKTTAARLLHENTLEYNSSSERGINDVKKIVTDCQTPSIFYSYRLVILDEADYFTAEAQASLRNSIEALSHSNMFVFTANNPEKLSDPLHSRLLPVDFSFNKADVLLKQKMINRCVQVLRNEGMDIDKNIVATIVNQQFPDMRKILKKLQYEVGLGI